MLSWKHPQLSIEWLKSNFTLLRSACRQRQFVDVIAHGTGGAVVMLVSGHEAEGKIHGLCAEAVNLYVILSTRRLGNYRRDFGLIWHGC
jgi:hypothetical protein